MGTQRFGVILSGVTGRIGVNHHPGRALVPLRDDPSWNYRARHGGTRDRTGGEVLRQFAPRNVGDPGGYLKRASPSRAI